MDFQSVFFRTYWKRNAEGQFVATFTTPSDAMVEYKLTKGTWGTLEKDAKGGDIDSTSSVQTSRRQTNLLSITLNGQAGREESKQLGDAFKQLEIKVGSTLSSPVWRCRDTAELALWPTHFSGRT